MELSQAQIDRLVREAQNGNTKAFGELYDCYFPQIYKYTYYKVSQEHVDDLVSSVFIKSWTKIKKYKKGSCPFSSWLFRIARNTIIDHYRTHREFYELEERIENDADDIDPSYLTEKTLNSERVHRALNKIDKNYRDVILLKFMNELSNREVAKILKTNEGNVRTLQFRALKKLRNVIESQDRAAELKLMEKEGKTIGLLKRLFVRG